MARHRGLVDLEARVRAAEALIGQGVGLVSSGKYEEAIACFDRVVEWFGEADERDLSRQVRIALTNKASVLLRLGRLDEAHAVFDLLCARASKAPNPNLALARAQAIVALTLGQAGRHEEAITAADVLLGRFPRDELGAEDILVMALRVKALAAAAVGRTQEAISLLGELGERFGGSDELVAREAVAKAWDKMGDLLEDCGEHERALRAYDGLLERFGDALEPELRRSVALALRGKSRVLHATGRYEEALIIEDEILERFRENPPRGRPYVALDALIGKVWILTKLGRTPEATVAYHEMMRCYGDEPERYVRERVAFTLVARAHLLIDDGRNEEVIAVVDELSARFGGASEPELRLHVARGLLKKALALGWLGRWKEVIAVTDGVIERYADSLDPELDEQAGRAMGLKADALRKLGEVGQALALREEVIERYADISATATSELVQYAQTQRAELLALSGQQAEAIVVADALIAHRDDGENGEQLHLADALTAKAGTLIHDRRYDDGITVLDELIGRFEDSDRFRLRRSVASALNNKVVALDRLGRTEEARNVFEDLLTRFGEEALMMFDGIASNFANTSAPRERERVASALYGKALALEKLGRRDRALMTLTELINLFRGDEGPSVQNIVSEARDARERIVGDERD